MVASDESDGDAEESRAASEAILVVVFVAEHVVDAADSGDHAGKSQRAHPHPADANTAVLGGIGLQAERAQLIAAAPTEEIEPDGDRDDNCDDEREVGSGAVESGIDVGETREDA